jgi:hypothetical protein
LYCKPDENTVQDMNFVEYAQSLQVDLLYPMSGIIQEEVLLQPGAINARIGE